MNSYDNLPLKVFILAGQSNMVGSGAIDHLDKLTKEIPTHSSYNEFRDVLWNGASYEYETRDDVYVKFNEKHGQLTVGRDTGYASQACFGPELMFGWTVGDAMDETVLLIKTAWGGKDLAVDFRSPSSGQGNYLVDSTLYGQFYLAMIADVRNALENLSMYVPGYDERSGYILSGMVWFQGWNDMIRTSKVQEYESNLANFIRDVRFDLSAPDLPIGKFASFWHYTTRPLVVNLKNLIMLSFFSQLLVNWACMAQLQRAVVSSAFFRCVLLRKMSLLWTNSRTTLVLSEQLHMQFWTVQNMTEFIIIMVEQILFYIWVEHLVKRFCCCKVK